MGFNGDVIRRRRDEMIELGVRVGWSAACRLWKTVIPSSRSAEELSRHNETLTLYFCVNYRRPGEDRGRHRGHRPRRGRRRAEPDNINERTFAKYLYYPEVPDVDLFLRPRGEQRTCNFLLWQSAYAELVFQDILWPDFDRRHLWAACEVYAQRDRRFGGAVPNPVAPS